MHITILRSSGSIEKRDTFSVQMNTSYMKRFLGHITDRSSHCSSCGNRCVKCRQGYDLDFSDSIVQIIEFPAVLPVMLEDPEEYLPASVKKHDILIAISVHEEILLSFIENYSTACGIIVPIEEPWWVSPYAQGRIQGLCRSRGIEIAFPKPFCSFDPAEGLLRNFKKTFKIGKPEIRYKVKEGCIIDAEVVCSAPCGATYFVARNMKSRNADGDLVNIIDSLLSAYPCTASTEVDRDFGDSIIHRAVWIQRDILKVMKLDAAAGSGR
jgi:hypothetical protein